MEGSIIQWKEYHQDWNQHDQHERTVFYQTRQNFLYIQLLTRWDTSLLSPPVPHSCSPGLTNQTQGDLEAGLGAGEDNAREVLIADGLVEEVFVSHALSGEGWIYVPQTEETERNMKMH